MKIFTFSKRVSERKPSRSKRGSISFKGRILSIIQLFHIKQQFKSLQREDCASVAQLVEQLICNQRVGGSNPLAGF